MVRERNTPKHTLTQNFGITKSVAPTGNKVTSDYESKNKNNNQ